MYHFHTPWKRLKPGAFDIFREGIEIEHGLKWGELNQRIFTTVKNLAKF